MGDAAAYAAPEMMSMMVLSHRGSRTRRGGVVPADNFCADFSARLRLQTAECRAST